MKQLEQRERCFIAARAVAQNEPFWEQITDNKYNSALHLFSSKSFLAEGYQIPRLPHGMYLKIICATNTKK